MIALGTNSPAADAAGFTERVFGLQSPTILCCTKKDLNIDTCFGALKITAFLNCDLLLRDLRVRCK